MTNYAYILVELGLTKSASKVQIVKSLLKNQNIQNYGLVTSVLEETQIKSAFFSPYELPYLFNLTKE